MKNKKIEKTKKSQDAEIIIKKLQNADISDGFRTKWRELIKKISHNEGDYENWYDSLSMERYNECVSDLANIMQRLKIPERFLIVVENYLLYNDTTTDYLPRYEPVDSFIRKNPTTGQEELLLQLDADTKKKDLQSKKLWERIKRLKTYLYDYGALTQRKKRYFGIHEQMYKWKLRGYTYEQIREKAKKKFGYNIRFTEDVGTILKRYKKQVGITGTRKMKK